jgi:signal transduction histidine kinase/HAMP domain-containing protein
MTAAPRQERRSGSRRDTLRRRLRHLVAGMLALLVLTGAAGILALQAATHETALLSKGYSPASDSNRKALVAMLDVQTAVGAFALTGDRSFLSGYQQNAAQVVPTIEAVRHSLAAIGVHGLDADIAREAGLAETWLRDVAGRLATTPDPLHSPAAADLLDHELFDRFRTANDAVGERIMSTRLTLRAQSLHRRNLALIGIGATAALALAAGTLYGLRLARRLTGPLGALHATVRAMEQGDLSARTDARVGPVEVRDVAGAVNRLGAQVEAGRDAVATAEELRKQAQPLSESLRIGVEPYTMCQAFVVGLGSVFGVDRVWLHTFEDNRVPSLTVQWHRPGTLSVPPARDADRGALRSIANRLWHSGGMLALDDRPESIDPDYAPILDSMTELGSGAAVIVAVGEGASAMGVLALGYAGAPHVWTPTELSLINRLSAELAHSLVQNNVVQRQHEVIEQLRALDEAKTALVSTVSHELRTPLTSISGYLEMVLDGDAGELPEQAAEMLRVVERNTARLRALIEDLLTQSRIESGRLRVTVTRLDVADVLREVAGSLRPVADGNRVALQVDVPHTGELCVEGDLRQLEQAVTNLVATALKFTPAGGRARLIAQLDGPDTVLITVADTGIGIPAADLPRLFDRFFRASNATEAEIPGTGLGLSIVREIVRAHGGELDVRSQVDVGTTFLVRLPRADADVPTAAQTAGARG